MRCPSCAFDSPEGMEFCGRCGAEFAVGTPEIRPIRGVSTSTAGFVGPTERGPTEPQLVTSWLDYQRWFGRHVDPAITYLPYCVRGFFDNGGQRAFIARIVRSDAVLAVQDLSTPDVQQNLQVEAAGPGEWGNRLFVRVQDGTERGFQMTILYYRTLPPLPGRQLVNPSDPNEITNADRRDPDVQEDYDNLGFDVEGPNYVLYAINAKSRLVRVRWTDDTRAPERPNNGAYTQSANGDDGATALSATEFAGTRETDPYLRLMRWQGGARQGLLGLEMVGDISILCAPDHVHPSLNAANQTQVMNEVVNQCERLNDRIAVLSISGGQEDVATISPPKNTSYGAVYYPWVRVFDPHTQHTLLVPPVGHVAGIYARTDMAWGVHKAPANEVVKGIVTRDLNAATGPLEFNVPEGQLDILNQRGVNVIQDFRADRRGIRVWGDRTMSSGNVWKYINVRRLFLFLEQSITQGTHWAVFEVNDEPMLATVRRSITAFLTTVWKNGDLQGATAEEAFIVKCDRSTMTQEGELNCLIGVAPVRATEFVYWQVHLD